jgi:tricarballylate dehydrogenase
MQLTEDWFGYRTTYWDAHMPAGQELENYKLSSWFTKLGYPLGIMVNTRPARFVDKGADFSNYTYAAVYRKAALQKPVSSHCR